MRILYQLRLFQEFTDPDEAVDREPSPNVPPIPRLRFSAFSPDRTIFLIFTRSSAIASRLCSRYTRVPKILWSAAKKKEIPAMPE